MSDMTLSKSATDILSLAQEFGIDLKDDMSTMLYSGGESKYTNYDRPKQIRQAFDTHKLDGQIKWTEIDYDGNPENRSAEVLYEPDPNGGEPRPLQAITELRGVIVNYQQRDELRYYDGERTQTLCSVIGYTKPDGTVVRDLPSNPYSMKHSFEQDRSTKKWSVNTEKPNKVVEQLGLVGYRGERVTSCAECIRCGMSTEVIAGIGDNGADKKISCEPRGKLHLAVFEVSLVKKVKADETGIKGKAKFIDQKVTYRISDLVDFAGESIGDFILIEVPMSKSSIQGKYVKGTDNKKDEDKSIDGYEGFVRNLNYTYKDPRNPMSNPKVHYVGLTFRKHPVAPTFQAHFESLGTASIDQFKAGNLYWQEAIGTKEIETLEVENIQAIQGDGTINITSQVVAEVPGMKTVIEVVNDDVEDDELPF